LFMASMPFVGAMRGWLVFPGKCACKLQAKC